MVVSDDTAPATKGDLRQMWDAMQGSMKDAFQAFRSEMNEQFRLIHEQFRILTQYIGTLPTKEYVQEKLDEQSRELLAHDEMIRDDILAYNNTKFAPLDVKVADHEVRIQNLEAVRR